MSFETARNQSYRFRAASQLFRKVPSYGKKLGISTEAEYLKTIPPFPSAPVPPGARCILVDRRISLQVICADLKIRYSGPEFTNDDEQMLMSDRQDVYWLLYYIHSELRQQTPYECKQQFSVDQCGLDAFEGLSIVTTQRTLLVDQCLVLPRSIPNHHLKLLEDPKSKLKKESVGAACLKVWNGDPELTWVFGDFASPRFRIVSCWK